MSISNSNISSATVTRTAQDSAVPGSSGAVLDASGGSFLGSLVP